MNKISSIETKKLENLYKQNKFNELEKETKKLLEIENDNIILTKINFVTKTLLLIFFRYFYFFQ